MFNGASSFNQDISNWKINPNADVFDMKDSNLALFNECPIKNEFKPKPLQNK